MSAQDIALKRGFPLRLTLPHWYGFKRSVTFEGGDLLTAANWDVLRASAEDGFRMPRSAAEWQSQADRNENLGARAKAVIEVIDSWGCSRLVSPGAGTGMLEHHIKVSSTNLTIRCGDYASAALEVLRGYLAEDAAVEAMDLKNPSWVRAPDEAVLLHRVDMELSDAEWATTFEQLARAGVKHVVIVPCGLLSLMTALQQARVFIESALSDRQLMRNGWVRSPRRLLQLFSNWYDISDSILGAGFEVWGLTLKSY